MCLRMSRRHVLPGDPAQAPPLNLVVSPGLSENSSDVRDNSKTLRQQRNALASCSQVRASDLLLYCRPDMRTGYDADTVNLIRGFDSSPGDYKMEGHTPVEGNDQGEEAAWEDEEMPVDTSFKLAMRDVSKLTRCAHSILVSA